MRELLLDLDIPTKPLNIDNGNESTSDYVWSTFISILKIIVVDSTFAFSKICLLVTLFKMHNEIVSLETKIIPGTA